MKCKIEELQTKHLELKETCKLQQDEIYQLKLLTKKVKVLSEASDYALGSLTYLAIEYDDFRIKIAETIKLPLLDLIIVLDKSKSTKRKLQLN